MRGRAIKFLAALTILVVLVLTLGVPRGAAEETGADGPFRVGMVTSLFRDVADPMIPTMLRPLRGMLETQTGMEGSLVPVKGWDRLGEQLDSGKLHLAVFHGFEFAWARQKFEKLKPLVVTVGEKGLSQVCLVVRDDCTAKSFDDLKGTTLAVPRRTREHCYVFLERRCVAQEQTLATWFERVSKPFSVEDAALSVISGKATAMLTDGASLEYYRQQRPAGYARLRVLEKSEAFPPAVFAYRPGVVSELILRRFKQGLLCAHENADSREIMTFCKIARFDKVPDDYDKALETAVKTYPPPSASPSR